MKFPLSFGGLKRRRTKSHFLQQNEILSFWKEARVDQQLASIYDFTLSSNRSCAHRPNSLINQVDQTTGRNCLTKQVVQTARPLINKRRSWASDCSASSAASTITSSAAFARASSKMQFWLPVDTPTASYAWRHGWTAAEEPEVEMVRGKGRVG